MLLYGKKMIYSVFDTKYSSFVIPNQFRHNYISFKMKTITQWQSNGIQRPTLFTYHMVFMIITLQDMEVMMGLLVEGLLMLGKTNKNWADECKHLLGVSPPCSIPKPNQSKFVLDETRIKLNDSLTTLEPLYLKILMKIWCNNMLDIIQQSYWVVVYLWIHREDRSLLFLSNSWIPLVMQEIQLGQCNATYFISGALTLVQMWVFAKFPHMVPNIKQPHQNDNKY